MIECSDATFYTGISTDVLRRYQQHLLQLGAKYFRGRQPQQLVYVEVGHTRSSASKRESAIKKLRRSEKLLLLNAACNVVAEYR